MKSSDHCRTPEWLYKALDVEFAFDLDPCPLNAKENGLYLDWHGRRVFCNPPYSDILPWVQKAIDSDCLTVFLVPARTNGRWSTMLREGGAEFRYFARTLKFEHRSGRLAKPLAGSMVAILPRRRGRFSRLRF